MFQQQKVETQHKWKDVWDTECQIRKLKMSIEQGLKPVQLKQFSPPIEPVVQKQAALQVPQALHPKSRTASLTPLSTHKSHKDIFITGDLPEENMIIKTSRNSGRSKGKEEQAQYPWENRERSRDQFRTIANQQQ